MRSPSHLGRLVLLVIHVAAAPCWPAASPTHDAGATLVTLSRGGCLDSRLGAGRADGRDDGRRVAVGECAKLREGRRVLERGSRPAAARADVGGVRGVVALDVHLVGKLGKGEGVALLKDRRADRVERLGRCRPPFRLCLLLCRFLASCFFFSTSSVPLPCFQHAALLDLVLFVFFSSAFCVSLFLTILDNLLAKLTCLTDRPSP